MNRILYKDKYCAVVQKRAGEQCENGTTAPNVTLLCAEVAKALAADSAIAGGNITETAPTEITAITAANGSSSARKNGSKTAYPYIECVNRLDMPVTGATLVAFSKEAFASFTHLFASAAHDTHQNEPTQKSVSKTYWAIVEKPRDSASVPPLNTDITLTHRISFNTKHKKAYIRPYESGAEADTGVGADTKQKAQTDAHGTNGKTKNAAARADKNWKKAALTYRVIGMGERYLFLRVELHTGRTHQIRAQLAFCGLPIKGDVKYGARRKDTLAGIRLHARELVFTHPFTHERVRVSSPLIETDALWDAFAACAKNRDSL